MPMRYPLTDLPLDSFMHTSRKSSLKRPLSPSATLLSPSKRRILSEEGLFSPERRRGTQKSCPLFEEIFESPKPVSRKIDFASLNHPITRPTERNASFYPETPTSDAPSVPKLAPSPEITSPLTSRPSTHLGDELPTPQVKALVPVMLIPRELPSVSDRQSIHWPGFDIYLDTHIAIRTSASVAQRQGEVELSDVDEAKENMKPKKRISKTPVISGNSSKLPRFVRPDACAGDVGPLTIGSIIFSSPVKQALTPKQKEEKRSKNMLYMLSEQEDDDETSIVEGQL